ncbi:probable NADH dehydrogenase [ubiquinone] 1 alpha subcomplex subunit 12 isoform X1 [Rhipicephalus sanguineus]|uniref:probable NADH dehydrogenase [ubiquinone] 1 alpha subcomplex subunit 12 isoform X1 n=1 Tax=Rhipicephalus sanguineus TaxID=34632 RepID=UPI0020C3DF88|nr:probable NADH dehydrogenase [ubiquinone] 1 alpha subcomplex subunit 12 isoform X1 [Rhipicephalus sanguineus]
MASFFGLDKIQRLSAIIKHNGGIMRSAFKLTRMDELRMGTLVGVDKYGNKYYEDDRFFFGRNRWVEYADYYYFDYDGSQVPSEWHGWLHYMTDLPPTKNPPPQYKWLAPHTENMTGTKDAYMPYSTVLPKIHSWVPPKTARK